MGKTHVWLPKYFNSYMARGAGGLMPTHLTLTGSSALPSVMPWYPLCDNFTSNFLAKLGDAKVLRCVCYTVGA